MASRVQDLKKHFKDCVSLLQDEMKAVNMSYRGICDEDSRQLTEEIDRMEKIKLAVSRDKMRVVFFGKTSNGKSTVINALLGQKVCPTGYGSVTRCFCSVEKGSETCGVYSVRSIEAMEENQEDYVDVQTFKSLESAASFFGEEHVPSSTMISIEWPEEECPLLKDDVAIVDTPGIDAEAMIDDEITRICSDADVFVYVCDGKRTIEVKEKVFLIRVKKILSNLTSNNLFILFNWWDEVCSEGDADRVKDQHVTKAKRFLMDEFHFTEKSAEDRIFFISAKEALSIARAAQHTLVGDRQERLVEFNKFEKDLQKCLTEHGLQTRLGRHCDSARSSITCTVHLLERELQRLKKTRIGLDGELADLDSSKNDVTEGMDTLETVREENEVTIVKNVGLQVDAAIKNAKRKIEKQVNQCKKTYQFGGLEKFKADLLAELEPSYVKINMKLQSDLVSMYDRAASDLTREFDKHHSEQQTLRNRHGGDKDEKHDTSDLPLLEMGKCIVSPYWNSFKHFVPQSKYEGVGVVAAEVIATSFSTMLTGVGITGYVGYKAIRWICCDDIKEEVKSQVVHQLCVQLDEQVQSFKDNFQKLLVEKLESRAAYYSGRLRDDLQSITGEFLRKKKEKEKIEKEVHKLETFKQSFAGIDRRFKNFQAELLFPLNPEQKTDSDVD